VWLQLLLGIIAQMMAKLELHSKVADELRLTAAGRSEAASRHEDKKSISA
jgi:hypothetical protein